MALLAGRARRLAVATLPLACSFDAGGIGHGSGLETASGETGASKGDSSSTTIESGATIGSSAADTSTDASTDPATTTTSSSTTMAESGGSSSEGPSDSSETTGVPDPCAGPPPFEVTLEAADAALSGMMMLGTLGNGQQYVYSPTENDGSATFSFSVDCPGEYVIWGFVYDGDPLISDAFGTAADRMQVDLGGNSTDWEYGCQTGLVSWTWETVESNDDFCLASSRTVYALEPGMHSVVFTPTEGGSGSTSDPGEAAALQRILVTNDQDFVP